MRKGKLRITEDGMLIFYCPGCKRNHGIYVDKLHHVNWDFNGNYDKPTFKPSILVQSGHYMPENKGKPCWCDYNKEHPDADTFKCAQCHSFVTDGKIQFLSDCTHELAGQTVDMVDYDE